MSFNVKVLFSLMGPVVVRKAYILSLVTTSNGFSDSRILRAICFCGVTEVIPAEATCRGRQA